MKLCRLVEGTTAMVVDPDRLGVVVVHTALESFRGVEPDHAATLAAYFDGGEESWVPVIDDWDDVGPALASLEAWARTEAGSAAVVTGAGLGAPLPDRSSHIFAIGANFATHAARSQAFIEGDDLSTVEGRARALVAGKADGVPPWGFTVLPGTVVGPGATVEPPAGMSKLDYEAEVGAILRLDGAGAVAVWGVMPWNDLSLRDKYFGLGPRVDEGPLTWSLQKNFNGGSACGPWVVIDEVEDIHDIEITLRVNGVERQRGSTGDMVYRFDEAIDHFQNFIPMRSGDVVASGTPAGTAIEQGPDGPFLTDGDEVEVELAGIGVLRNHIAMASA